MWSALPYGPVPTLQLHHRKATQPFLISFTVSLPPPAADRGGHTLVFSHQKAANGFTPRLLFTVKGTIRQL